MTKSQVILIHICKNNLVLSHFEKMTNNCIFFSIIRHTLFNTCYVNTKNLPFCAFLTKQLPILICYNAADVVAAKVNSWPLYFPTAQFLTDLKEKRSSFYQSHTMKVWELFKATTVLKSISIINIDTKQLNVCIPLSPHPNYKYNLCILHLNVPMPLLFFSN